MSHPVAEGRERIVVSRLRFLGDVVLSTPVLEALRAARPEASIEYLTFEEFAPVLAHHPGVDRVLTMPSGAGPRATLAAVRALRRPRVDWFFDLFSNPRSALLVGLSRPRHSVGQQAGLRSRVYSVRRPRRRASQVMAHLDKLTPLVGEVEERLPRLYVTPAAQDEAARKHGFGPETTEVFIHPGATWPWRLWPSERWPQLIRLLEESGSRVRVNVVTPPGDGTALARGIAGSTPTVRVLPPMGLRELMATLTHGSLYVGNDGGVLHMAVALGVPTVGLFGGENRPEEWFPYGHLGPFRPVLRSSRETFRDRHGNRFPRPDAIPEEVMDAVEAVWRR